MTVMVPPKSTAHRYNGAIWKLHPSGSSSAWTIGLIARAANTAMKVIKVLR
jgi:hypothetical protein